MKYKLIDEKGTFLKRLVALTDFGDVKKGDLGGLIQGEHNLSHCGTCWVYKDARVLDKVRIRASATIRDCARVSENAIITDNAKISGFAVIKGSAFISDCASVSGQAIVCGSACINGKSQISGKSRIGGEALITRFAQIKGNAQISGSAVIGGHAILKGHISVTSGLVMKPIITIRDELLYSLNIFVPKKAKSVILYKLVHKDLSSVYDTDFIYTVGKTIKAKETDGKICGKGLHVSTPTYWTKYTYVRTLLTCEVLLKDIIRVGNGQVKVKKLKVLAKEEI
jgi:carbonic anhydrase/acetyltransferase-like protein (isoleucine patch superfamily)